MFTEEVVIPDFWVIRTKYLEEFDTLDYRLASSLKKYCNLYKVGNKNIILN